MLKFILLCIGIIFLFESSIYLFFPQKTKEAIKMIASLDNNKLRNIALPFFIIGLILIYLTLRNQLLL